MAGQYHAWLLCLFMTPVVSFVVLDGALSKGLSSSHASLKQRPEKKHINIQQSSSARTRLYMDYGDENKLWERLEVEEDEEPCWYLVNCVATMELALLQQCQSVTSEMEETEVVKFVVPLEKKTRSHGSKKIVTETKVKYPGYVFAKLRLCAQTYQTIQQLDLCRSWMGTINQKGHRKLPPRPVALNEQEIEKFGLEALEETDIEELEIAAIRTDESGIIFDDDNEEDDDGRTPKVDMQALKVYEGLKVDDMVKVVNRGTFYNEDGVVRRLKEGKIFVRFYTYGTMFEEWLRPTDVRKLKADEILRGLSGPTAPITQQQFDDPQKQKRDNEFSQSARGTRFGNRGQIRNRREDRNADRFRRDNDSQYSEREERENWNWYKDQQRNKRGNQMDSFQDGSRRITPGSRDWNDRGRNERFNQDNRVGQRPNNQQNPRDQRSVQNQRVNRQNNSAISGQDDWSAFVSNPGDSSASKKPEPAKDDFFDSLMKDLSKDIEPTPQAPQGSRPRRTVVDSKTATESEDDFFASLLNDLSAEEQNTPSTSSNPVRRNSDASRRSERTPSSNLDDDFFASLAADLENAIPSQHDSSIKSEVVGSTKPSSTESSKARNSSSGPERTTSSNLDDDFFASLEADLANAISSDSPNESDIAESGNGNSAFVGTRESRAHGGKQAPPSSFGSDEMDNFFASLETESGISIASVFESKNTESPQVEESVGQFSAVKASAKEASSTQTRNDGPSPDQAKHEAQSKTMSSSGASLDDSSLAKMTVPVLKEMLRDRGLKVSGKKAELVERLLHAS